MMILHGAPAAAGGSPVFRITPAIMQSRPMPLTSAFAGFRLRLAPTPTLDP